MASLEKAIENLGIYRLYKDDERSFSLACLLREKDWRPISAPWWSGKSASIIGADLSGNFIILHCDGTVRLWVHNEGQDVKITNSLSGFLSNIEYDPSALP